MNSILRRSKSSPVFLSHLNNLLSLDPIENLAARVPRRALWLYRLSLDMSAPRCHCDARTGQTARLRCGQQLCHTSSALRVWRYVAGRVARVLRAAAVRGGLRQWPGDGPSKRQSAEYILPDILGSNLCDQVLMLCLPVASPDLH